MKTLVEKSEIIVDDKGFENLFLDIEDRKVIPFIYVIRKSDKPNELVLKSKIDGSKNPYWKEVSKEVMNCFRVVTDYKKRVEVQLTKEGKPITDYEQGELKGKQETARNLFGMSLSVDQVAKATGLDLDTVLKLKNEVDSKTQH